MQHELAQHAGKIDWDFIGDAFCDRSAIAQAHYGLSDEGVCERWVYDPYFQSYARIAKRAAMMVALRYAKQSPPSRTAHPAPGSAGSCTTFAARSPARIRLGRV